MESTATIAASEEAGVVTLTLNRPESLNALNVELLGDLITLLDAVRDSTTARALLLTGAGRAFSSGADLASGGGGKDAGYKLDHYYNPILERIQALPIPVVAAVNGAAVGAGCALALSADFVLAKRSTYFLQAFINIGLVPDAGSTWLLTRAIGRPRALQMMMLGERVSAEQAEQWGMIYHAVDDDALAREALALAQRLAKGPTRAYGLIRQSVRRGLDQSLTETLASERESQRLAGLSADFAEGVAAFREKRGVRFTGR